MKLKSLLLGSAAALALSTGAQAADPVAEFVSLDVCDAYGISGLTVASDDTCLLISGEVEYDYWYEEVNGTTSRASLLDWNLSFEATTQTDAGRAIAAIKLVDAEAVAWSDADDDGLIDAGEAGLIPGVAIDEAYVSFGDTTVLTAGLTGSLFGLANDQYILSDTSLVGDPGTSAVFQVVSDLGNGLSVGAAIEALADDPGGILGGQQTGGRAGVVVGYDDGSIVANLGAYVYDLYNTIDNGSDTLWDVYADVATSFDIVSIYADIAAGYGDANTGIAGNETYVRGSLSGEVALDIATIRAGVRALYEDGSGNTEIAAGAGVMFALTDTVDLDVAVIYNDKNTALDDNFNTYPLSSDLGADRVHGIVTLSNAFTDTLSGSVWATVAYDTNASQVDGYGAGVTAEYAPGGDFVLDGGAGVFYDNVNSETDYAVHLGAKKSF
ncbi:hypothetical protein [Pelagibacterium halotolerans]|uniref:hypothetical protein n=1 Tax=Pelagibacterium halotolerans TaxID=531813 RepID=UPI00384F82E1